MNGKKIITIVLIIFVAVSMFYLVAKETKNTSSNTVEASKPAPTKENIKADNYILYYFCGDKRCPTCIKIENLTDKTVKEEFADDLETGKLEWKIVNYDKEQNLHFKEDYKLEYQTLVIVGFKDGKQGEWKILPRIWELVHNEQEFGSYVSSEIKNFMADKNE
ncbi:MAG: nitrophenyl compound nitroreductase subunit ArsF family protein [Vulcanimicrobiota bacterium]